MPGLSAIEVLLVRYRPHVTLGVKVQIVFNLSSSLELYPHA